MKIIRRSQQVTTDWSGGQTRELYIYPEESCYADRDFDLRISTATIELEESTFTELTGFSRKLMVLEGSLILSHENHHSVTLHPFEQDTFSGDWKTKSKGKAADFNVIFNPNQLFDIEVYKLKNESFLSLNVQSQVYIYVYSGAYKIGSQQLELGDFVVLEEGAEVECEKDGVLVVVKAIN